MHMHNILLYNSRPTLRRAENGRVGNCFLILESPYRYYFVLDINASCLEQSIVAFMWSLIVHYSLKDNVKVRFYV